MTYVFSQILKMNSKQRRKFKRRWKYTVGIYNRYESPSEELMRLVNMDSWCHDRFGKHKYRMDGYAEKFYFDSEENLVEFKLYWA